MLGRPRPDVAPTCYPADVADPALASRSVRPAPQVQLTLRERTDPYNALKGPSLLNREKFGAKKSGGERSPNLLLDDNPFNDPVKYWPFKGWAFPPSDYLGPDDPRESDDLGRVVHGGNALQLGFVFGYTGRRARQNLFYNTDGRIVYHSAALGVVYDKGSRTHPSNPTPTPIPTPTPTPTPNSGQPARQRARVRRLRWRRRQPCDPRRAPCERPRRPNLVAPGGHGDSARTLTLTLILSLTLTLT